MVEMEVTFRNAGRRFGVVYVRLKTAVQYAFYFVMIAYECYDCVSDGMNVYQYSKGDSLDVSSRNESVYRVFFFSLIVSVLCAVSSSIGYFLMIIGLSKTLHRHQEVKNNTTKLGAFIVFITLFCEVCFEESIQSIIMYYYIVRCSVVYDFWKVSLFVCITLSLLYAGYTFFKGSYVWFKESDSLPRNYPSCLVPCYGSKPSFIGFMAVCVFGTILALGLFALNISSLVNIIKYSEVEVPHLVAVNNGGLPQSVKISPVKDLVKSETLVKKLACMKSSTGQPSHFLGEQASFNCSSAFFTLTLAKSTKKIKYRVHYCYDNDLHCNAIKLTNITIAFTHDLCSPDSPVFTFVSDPLGSTRTTSSTLLISKGS